MKIAICISGLLRGYEEKDLVGFIESLPCAPDIFITTWNVKYTHLSLDHPMNGSVSLDNFKHDSIRNNIKSIKIYDWVDQGISNSFYNKQMLRDCLRLKSSYEFESGFTYDLVYRTRFDLVYEGNLFTNLIEDVIYVPPCIPYIGKNHLNSFRSNFPKSNIDLSIKEYFDKMSDNLYENFKSEVGFDPREKFDGVDFWDQKPQDAFYITTSKCSNIIEDVLTNNLHYEDTHELLYSTQIPIHHFDEGFTILKNWREIK